VIEEATRTRGAARFGRDRGANGHKTGDLNGSGTALRLESSLVDSNSNGALGAAEAPRAVPTSAFLPTLRDAFFRRALALADLAAALGGLILLGWATRRGLAPSSVASVPLIVLLAKVAGRYDHDEVVLRKSTLDEAPQLFVLAAAFALAWSMVAFFAGVHMELGGAGVVTLWASVGTLLVALRAGARALAQASAPAERALVVGPSRDRSQVARALACDPSAHVDVVGFLPLHDERRTAQPDWNGSCRRPYPSSRTTTSRSAPSCSSARACGIRKSIRCSI